jgi:hypothetical protein
LYNRWKVEEAGVFIRMMQGLSGGKAERRTMIDDLKAHRTASSWGVCNFSDDRRTGMNTASRRD